MMMVVMRVGTLHFVCLWIRGVNVDRLAMNIGSIVNLVACALAAFVAHELKEMFSCKQQLSDK